MKLSRNKTLNNTRNHAVIQLNLKDHHKCSTKIREGFPGGSLQKYPPVNVGDTGSILGLERFPEEEMATLSSILAWEIPWTEKPGGLQSMGVTKYSDRT